MVNFLKTVRVYFLPLSTHFFQQLQTADDLIECVVRLRMSDYKTRRSFSDTDDDDDVVR